jgi:hypothetical protein
VARGKIPARNAFHDVNPDRGHAHPKHIRIQRRFELFEHGGGRAKFFERCPDAHQIVGRMSHPQVDGLRESRPPVKTHGVAADDEIVNVARGEYRQQACPLRL